MGCSQSKEDIMLQAVKTGELRLLTTALRMGCKPNAALNVRRVERTRRAPVRARAVCACACRRIVTRCAGATRCSVARVRGAARAARAHARVIRSCGA
jgi:hypothetical protein